MKNNKTNKPATPRVNLRRSAQKPRQNSSAMKIDAKTIKTSKTAGTQASSQASTPANTAKSADKNKSYLSASSKRLSVDSVCRYDFVNFTALPIEHHLKYLSLCQDSVPQGPRGMVA